MSTEKVYCVYCHTCPDGMQYIGTTCNVKSRWRASGYKGTSLAPYIDKFGWKSLIHEVLVTGLTRDEALKIEDELICKARENGTCINQLRSGHYSTSCECIEKRREQSRVRSRVHYEANKERYYEHNKTFREENPDYHKNWREANPDYMREYCREWRKRKKEQNKKSPRGIF